MVVHSLRRKRKLDRCELEVSLIYKMSARTN